MREKMTASATNVIVETRDKEREKESSMSLVKKSGSSVVSVGEIPA